MVIVIATGEAKVFIFALDRVVFFFVRNTVPQHRSLFYDFDGSQSVKVIRQTSYSSVIELKFRRMHCCYNGPISVCFRYFNFQQSC